MHLHDAKVTGKFGNLLEAEDATAASAKPWGAGGRARVASAWAPGAHAGSPRLRCSAGECTRGS